MYTHTRARTHARVRAPGCNSTRMQLQAGTYMQMLLVFLFLLFPTARSHALICRIHARARKGRVD